MSTLVRVYCCYETMATLINLMGAGLQLRGLVHNCHCGKHGNIEAEKVAESSTSRLSGNRKTENSENPRKQPQ